MLPPEDLALVWATAGVYADAVVRHVAEPGVLIPNKPGFIVHLAHRIAHNCAGLRLLRVSSSGFPQLAKGVQSVQVPAAIR